MKLHPDITIDGIFAEVLKNPAITRVDGQPTSPEERAKIDELMITVRAHLETKMRTLCVGCGADVPMVDTLPCECGGFVCANCRTVEEPDQCDHDISHVEHLKQ
jgi:hypothetical protein